MDEENSELNDESEKMKVGRLTHVLVLFQFLWQSLFRITDAAISLILSFLKLFFALAGSYLGLQKISHFPQIFPRTLYRAKKYLGRKNDNFERITVCPQCHILYLYKDYFH